MELMVTLARQSRHPGGGQHPQRRTRPRFADRIIGMAGGPSCSTAPGDLIGPRTSSRSTAAEDGCSEPPRERRPGPDHPVPPSPNWAARLAWLALAVYVVYALSLLDVTWARFVTAWATARSSWTACGRRTSTSWAADAEGMIESLQIAVLASFAGILLSLPIGLLAARNLMPAWVSWSARAVIALCRSFHPVIVAILFVKAVGFGALAGILALIVASIGFIAKLFAEAIEEISLKQVEAVRATGASFMLNVMIFGVLPQVLPASSASPPTSSTPTCATPPWSASSAPAASAHRCSPPSSASTTTSCAILLAIIAVIMVAELSRRGAKGVPVKRRRQAAGGRRNGSASPRRVAALHGRLRLLPARHRRGGGLVAAHVEIIPEFLYDAPEQMATCSSACGPSIGPTTPRACTTR
jgi:phosphonate transport system permease protein